MHGECPPEGCVLMAAVSIPVFWYMLYDESSLAFGPDKENPNQPYHYLTTPTVDGLNRAEARWPAVSRVVGRQITALFQTWLAFVREKADAYIHCETYELFGMTGDHNAFEMELRTCLAAFDHVPERTENRVNLNNWWKRLLGQANVSTGYKGSLEPVGNHSYCGSSCHYDVSWSEDNDVVCGVLSEIFVKSERFGREPEDLLHYLEYVCGPVGVTRLYRCHCGSETFRVVVSREGHFAARRTCAECGASSLFAGDEEWYWKDAEPVDWACSGCGGSLANLGLGLELDHTESQVIFASLGHRCVGCCRLSHVLGWECFESLSDMDTDGACDWAHEQYVKGANLAEAGQYVDALACFRDARRVLPDPPHRPGCEIDMLCEVVHILFRLGEWKECCQTAQDALQLKDESGISSFFHQRMGQALFELGRTDEAADWLALAYADRGLAGFKDEDPKYLDSIRARLTLPPGGSTDAGLG